MGQLLVQPNYFQVETDNPSDDRFVRADEATRLAISFKYAGLQVFQEDTQALWLLSSIGPDVWVQTSASTNGHVIQDGAAPVANQPNLNFLAGITITDNPGNSSSDVSLDVDGGVEP